MYVHPAVSVRGASCKAEPLVAKKCTQVTVLLDHGEFERSKTCSAERGFEKSTLIARLVWDHWDRVGYQQQRRLPLEEVGGL